MSATGRGVVNSVLEIEQQHRQEIRDAFYSLFPLADYDSLPTATSEIGEFLKRRIAVEVETRGEHWVRQVARVLCEASVPKTHLVDMARIVVDKARKYEMEVQKVADLKKEHERQIEAATKDNKWLREAIATIRLSLVNMVTVCGIMDRKTATLADANKLIDAVTAYCETKDLQSKVPENDSL